MKVNNLQENSTSGWIRIYRSIQDHWIWQDDKKLKWWLDLMLETNHSDKKVPIGYDIIECKRGQTVRSLSGWADRWKVSKDTARNFLEMLKKDKIIHTENMGKTTRITICNYDSYQGGLHDGQTMGKRKTNDGQTTPIHKQELNNDKNDKKNTFAPPTLPEFKQYFSENGFGEELADRAWRGYDAAGWHDSQGKMIKNWRQKCQHVWFKDSNRGAGEAVKTTKSFRITDYFNYSDYKTAAIASGLSPLSQPEFEEAARPKAKIA